MKTNKILLIVVIVLIVGVISIQLVKPKMDEAKAEKEAEAKLNESITV